MCLHLLLFYTNKAQFPIFTYAEIQFVKAEAAFRKGDKFIIGKMSDD